jgi:hypothetical protein
MPSGPAQGFRAETLRSIRMPFVVDTAMLDEILDNAVNSRICKALESGMWVSAEVP